MPSTHPALARAEAFCRAYNIRVPILQAPMAGACPPSLAIAVANAGGLGGCGALLMEPAAIKQWAAEMRAGSNGGFQFNLWIPDPPPKRDAAHEAAVRAFLGQWGPAVAPEAGDVSMPDFAAQCDALLEAGPAIVSSIMGVYPPDFVARMKARGVKWFATVSSVAAVRVPVIATGGIGEARGVAAALLLGASAVQIGTGFLRCPETRLAPAWADAIGRTQPEDTIVTRAFSGRPGRAIANDYARAASSPGAPPPAPYPVQRG